MRTTLYLLRHAATLANLAHPAKLQGQRPTLPDRNATGLRTREFLAIRAFDACYFSPLLRAVQTAQIVAEPHQLAPIAINGLTECDISGLGRQIVGRDSPKPSRGISPVHGESRRSRLSRRQGF